MEWFLVYTKNTKLDIYRAGRITPTYQITAEGGIKIAQRGKPSVETKSKPRGPKSPQGTQQAKKPRRRPSLQAKQPARKPSSQQASQPASKAAGQLARQPASKPISKPSKQTENQVSLHHEREKTHKRRTVGPSKILSRPAAP